MKLCEWGVAALCAGAGVAAGQDAAGWAAGRVTLGVEVAHLRLTDNHRSPDREGGRTFVGRVNLLDEERDIFVSPVATFHVARHLRARLWWEKLEARTFNYNLANPYGPHGQTDGIAELSGPVALLEVLWPVFDDTLFPHAGAGVFAGFADFKEDAFWHLGYESQADWEHGGKPATTRAGFLREIHVDDTLGWVASAGLAWRPCPHFQLDLDVRQTWVEADCEYGYLWEKGGWDPHRHGSFSFDNLSWGLSAAFVF